MSYELLDFAGNHRYSTTCLADVIMWVVSLEGTATFYDDDGDEVKMSYKGVIDDFDEIYDLDCGIYYVVEQGTYYLHNIYDPEYDLVF